MKKVKLPKKGKLILSKNLDKIKKRYPEDKYDISLVANKQGVKIGYQVVKKK